MTSTGYLWDLIQSIGDDVALAAHIEERRRAIPDGEEKKNLKTMLDFALSLRREKMSRLLDEAENGNPYYWCDFKHALGSWVRATEVYEATLEERDFEIMKKSADLFAMAASIYLGMEFEVCAACLADAMLTKQLTES